MVMVQYNREWKKCKKRPVKLPEITVSGVMSYRKKAKLDVSTVERVEVPKQGINALAKENTNSFICCMKEVNNQKSIREFYKSCIKKTSPYIHCSFAA